MRPKYLGPGKPKTEEPWWLNKIDSDRVEEFQQIGQAGQPHQKRKPAANDDPLESGNGLTDESPNYR